MILLSEVVSLVMVSTVAYSSCCGRCSCSTVIDGWASALLIVGLDGEVVASE